MSNEALGKIVRRNIEVAIKEDVDRWLSTVAALRGMTKKNLIAEALSTYCREHYSELEKLVNATKG